MTIQVLYQKLCKELQTLYTASEADLITSWILEKRAGQTKSAIIKNPSFVLEEKEVNKILHDVQLLLNHEPVQYVLGEAWFYKMKWKVNSHVLIPRPETEELVELIIQENRLRKEKLAVLDIGTGSGCIAIALKKHCPNFDLTAIDISKGALTVAQQNAKTHQTEIRFQQINFLDDNMWPDMPGFDLIVSNPPYIPADEKPDMEKNVADYEPSIALFVPATDPMLFYRKIADFGKIHLKKNGAIYLEIHENFGNKVANIFGKDYEKVTIKIDLFGKERMVTCKNYIQ